MSAETETNPQPTPNSGGETHPNQPLQGDDFIADDPEDGDGQPKTDNAAVEGDDDPAPKPKEAAATDDDDPIGDDEQADDGDAAPEFWSAEDKAFWANVPAEVRPLLKKYEQQRTEFTNQKAQEAAAERKKAMEEAQKAGAANDKYVQWWDSNAETFVRTFVDKWQGVDWDKLAAEEPAEWARLSQQRAREHQMLQTANAQAEEARKDARNRAEAAHQEDRRAEHAKLAKEFPKEFGTPEAAKRTYDVLASYLVKEGIAPERINAIYEANIVKLARKAYKYDQLQAKAKGITNPKPPAQSASTTPTRVVPGARSSASPANEATRQAVERLRSGEHLSREDAALAFR